MQRVRQNSVTPVRVLEQRPLKLRLVSGLIVWLTVLHCPLRSRFASPSDDQHKPASLHPELATLGHSSHRLPGGTRRSIRLADRSEDRIAIEFQLAVADCRNLRQCDDGRNPARPDSG